MFTAAVNLVQAVRSVSGNTTDPAAARPNAVPIFKQFGVTNPADRAVLAETFTMLCDLNANRENHIWGYFVRNQVRPLWFSLTGRSVDVVIGNPPWLSYRFMSPTMQAQFKTFCEARNLWHGKKVATHQDLAGLFIARAVLRPGDSSCSSCPPQCSAACTPKGSATRTGAPHTLLGAATPRRCEPGSEHH